MGGPTSDCNVTVICWSYERCFGGLRRNCADGPHLTQAIVAVTPAERTKLMNRKERRAQKKTGAVQAPGSRQTELVFAQATQLHQAGRLGEAQQFYRHVLSLDPRHAQSLNNLAGIAFAAADYPAAAELYRNAIGADKRVAIFHLGLGQALEQLGRLEEAADASRVAIRLEPHLAMAHARLGLLLLRLEQPAQAESELRKALELAPDAAETWCDLGLSLQMQGKFGEVAECCRRSIALQPDLAVSYGTLGNRLILEQENLGNALLNYQRALLLRPDHAHLHNNLGYVLQDLGDYVAAPASFRQALALDPDYVDAHTNLIFALNFDLECSPEQQQAERRNWYDRHARPLAATVPAFTNSPRPDRRLRIGYLSAHFRHQAATYAFAGVLLHHDPEQFEVFCYSDTVNEDDLTRRLRSKVPHWHDVRGLSDELLASRIREDGIDICVDLVGHMSGNRLLALARKPAPVQVTGWGEPTGTGVPQIDWLLADTVLVPERWRPLLSEKVADLPCFLSHWTPEALPDPGPPPALRNGYVTFGSFNRLSKLTDETLRRWAAVLQGVPNSRLLIKTPSLSQPVSRDRFLSAMARAGIDPARISLRGNTDRRQHLAAYREIDLALDPYPHGGGMTTLEALAIGVPVLTIPGQTISSRLAAACLSAIGLTECIFDDVAALATFARNKAADLDALAALRANLPARLAASPAGNAAAYTRSVEAAYRTMWRSWCNER